MKFVLSVVVWGEQYLKLYLDAALPNHLAPGNVPALARDPAVTSCSYRLYVRESEAEAIRRHPAFQALNSYLPVEFDYIDDLLQDHPAKTCVLCNSHLLAQAGRSDTHVIFLTPDTLYSDGSFAELARLALSGKSTVLIGWFRVKKEAVLKEMLRYKEQGVIAVDSRTMVSLALKHRHPVSDTWFWDAENFIRSWPAKLLWRVDENNLLERSFHLMPLMVKPQRPEEELISHTHPGLQIDGNDYLSRACPDPSRIHIVADSDQIFCIDMLSEGVCDAAEFGSGRSNALELALWAQNWTWQSQRNNFRTSIRHHAGEIVPAQWEEAERRSDQVAASLFSLLELFSRSPAGAHALAEAAASYRQEIAGHALGLAGQLLLEAGRSADRPRERERLLVRARQCADNLSAPLLSEILGALVKLYRETGRRPEAQKHLDYLKGVNPVAAQLLEDERRPPVREAPPVYLLIVPRFIYYPGQYYIFPLGLAYVAAALKQAGFAVAGLNLNHSELPVAEQVARALDEHRPSTVLTGGLSVHYARIKEVVDATRAAQPAMTVVVGGGLVSSEPELMLQALHADVGVIGEGERTVVELARELKGSGALHRVNGIVYRDPSGTVLKTAPRQPIMELDELPYPAYDVFDYQTYLKSILPNDERDISVCDEPRPVYVVSSRSCPYSCTFCYHPLGKKYRARSLDNFFAELEYWVTTYRANIFYIMDELFSVDQAKIAEFCARIKSLKVKWVVQLTVRNISAELLDMMRDAGCYEISYGLESGSDAILKSMKKPITVAESRRAVELTYDCRIGVQGNFLFGDSAETLETAYQTIDLWLKTQKQQIYMIPVEVYPGTELYQRGIENGLISDRIEYITGNCPTLNLTRMSDADYLQVLLLACILRETYLFAPATVTSCVAGTMHPTRGQLYDLTITCPHCGETVLYRNMTQHGHRKFGCRSCYRRLDIPPFASFNQWPMRFKLAGTYSYRPSHSAEVKRFLDPGDRSWLVAENLKLSGCTGSFRIVRLFGINYLVPQQLTIEDIRRYRVQLSLVDLDTGSLIAL